ncbi:MAG: hypothetical protein LBQ50_01110 [Planctomycetaceae bacterium]|jgi:proteic killer suppression protein|nr:hypothetical protein [Planctomycetaceae bacterium]
MEILFANARIEKICSDDRVAHKVLGKIGAKFLHKQIEAIRQVANLEMLRFYPGHYHELIGNRWGQLAVSLGGRSRLIFEPGTLPRPEKPDGGLDWSKVTAVEIIEITDYHD